MELLLTPYPAAVREKEGSCGSSRPLPAPWPTGAVPCLLSRTSATGFSSGPAPAFGIPAAMNGTGNRRNSASLKPTWAQNGAAPGGEPPISNAKKRRPAPRAVRSRAALIFRTYGRVPACPAERALRRRGRCLPGCAASSAVAGLPRNPAAIITIPRRQSPAQSRTVLLQPQRSTRAPDRMPEQPAPR